MTDSSSNNNTTVDAGSQDKSRAPDTTTSGYMGSMDVEGRDGGDKAPARA
eukprot:jgi/Psemu1/60086/gm1.60086_g